AIPSMCLFCLFSLLSLRRLLASFFFPYTTLFRSKMIITYVIAAISFLFVIFGGIYASVTVVVDHPDQALLQYVLDFFPPVVAARSEEHTSELQSRFDLVCRLLLEKKNIEYSILTP